MPFCESRSTTKEAWIFVRSPSRSTSSTTTAIECGTSSRVTRRACSRTSSASVISSGSSVSASEG